MTSGSAPGVLLTGTIGAGKTALAQEMAHVLEESSLATAVVDLDWMGWVVGADAVIDEVIAANLKVVWPNLRSAGAERLIMTRAVHEPDAIQLFRKAVPDVELVVVRIVASPQVVMERLMKRDSGAELVEHLEETIEMARRMDGPGIGDIRIENEGPIREVATRLLAQLGWEAQ